MPFVNKFKILVCTACLMLVGQGFAVEKWTDVAVQPGQDGVYYIINNEKELAWIALNTMNKESTYKIKLNADLDLKGKLWLPIGAGHGGNGFKGEFDGQGHSISNVYIKSDELLSAYNDNCLAQNLGFFGINGGGTIKDFYLENVDIYATNSHINGCGNEISVGGLVGWKTASASTISNIIVSGKIYTSGKAQGVGGLIGNAHSNSISNSVSMVNITADGDSAFVGGIVGLVKNNEVKIDSCVYAGNVLESNGNGGAVGAVAGRVYKSNANANMNEVYYDVDLFGEEPVGVVGPKGQGGKTTGEASPVPDLNNEEVVCMLNKGTLDENGECDTQSPWSVGGQNISWNGSDGFKVTFDADGGTFPENSKTYKMLSNGNAITADEIASPTKDGAAFAGWSLTKGASEPALNLGVVTKPTRVYAVWKPVFTITFDANGGSFPDDGSLKKEKKVAKGDVITVEGIGNLPESYCKVSSTFGCDVTMFFTGWSFKSNPSTESEIVDLNNLDVFASKDTTLYAVWTSVETYTVTFNAGGHGKTKVNFVRVGAGETITKTVDPSADIGYQFGGWFTEDSILFESETTPITKSIILYAHWTPVDYTITYMLEDGTNDSENPETYNIETPTFEFAAPTREGYAFEKWYYDENFSSPATQITQGTTSGPKTLYAKWIPNIYTITYRAGSVGQGTVLPSEKEHGKPINLKLINDGFTRNGYTQTGWTTTDGGEKEYESGASYAENHDLTLFPTWDIVRYTITYDCEGCDVSNEQKFPTTYTIDTSFSIPKPASIPSGYKFGGWYKNAEFTGKTNNNVAKGTYGDFTFYGKLNKIYNITYVGTDKPNSAKTYTVDDAITLGTPASRDGYTFGGWYTNAEFEDDAVTSIAKGSTGDTTFYAKWIPETYNITYNIDGEAADLTPNTYTAEAVVALPEPTKDGYEFDGWYGNAEYTGEKVISIEAASTGDTTFYAKWNKAYPFLVNDFGAIKVYEDENGKLTAELDGASSGSVDAITAEQNVRVDAISFSRTFPVNETSSDMKFSSIVLPFTVDWAKISGAEFYEFVDVDLAKHQVSFCPAADENHTQLIANTPYIVRATSQNITFNLNGEKVLLNTAEMNNPVSGTATKWMFKGMYEYKKWNEGDEELGSAYGYTANAINNLAAGQFAKNAAGAFIRPFRAYLLKMNAQQGNRLAFPLKKSSTSLDRASIDEDSVPGTLDVVIVERETGETTAIGTLDTRTGEIKFIDSWFDMKGRRLNAKPTTKGIYYYNGKRVIVR